MVASTTDNLLNFFGQSNITYKNLIIDDSNGYSVKAAADIEAGEIVCSIPKDSILSIKNTAIADIIEQEDFAGILGISLAVMYEKSLGSKSPWFLYLNSIPAFENIPLFWSEEEVALLKNTDVGRAMEEDRQFLVDDYNDYIVPLFAKYPLLKPELMTLDDWLKANSLVSSRAFEVDEEHGESLVPWADLFNHKTDAEHVHIVGDDANEGWESDSNVSENDSIPELDDPEETPVEMTASDMLEMVTIKPVKAGEELFNTYGDHPNSSLLRLYGFCDTDNKYSSVSVDRQEVLHELGDSVAQVMDRVEFWDQVGKEIIEELKMMEEDAANGDCGGCADDDCHGCDEDMQDSKITLDANGVEIQNAGDQEECEISEDDEEGEELDSEMEGHDEDDIPYQDDFCFEADGKASFALTAFVHLLLMTPELFEEMATDLSAAIDMLVGIKQIENDSKGKGKKPELNLIANQLLIKIAKNRLEHYPPTTNADVLVGPAKWAAMLQNDERKILNKFLSLNA